jgi:hypothetical protein
MQNAAVDLFGNSLHMPDLHWCDAVQYSSSTSFAAQPLTAALALPGSQKPPPQASSLAHTHTSFVHLSEAH